MYYLLNENTDPYLNLALEEYLFLSEKFDDDIIIIWRNKESIFLGKNQNPYQEIRNDILFSDNFPILRRISGGGCVYHDLGNINFSFIQKNKELHEIDFSIHTRFMEDILLSLNLDPSITPRKDLFLGGKKISGSAQCIKGKNSLYHATLLYNSNLENLNLYLNSYKSVQSSSTKSVKSKVANINMFLDKDISYFLNYCIDYIIKNTKNPKQIIFNYDDMSKVKNLAEDKYKTSEWNFDKTPKFTISLPIELDGMYTLDILVNKWRVLNCKIYNDHHSINLNEIKDTSFFKDELKSKLENHYPNYDKILNLLF